MTNVINKICKFCGKPFLGKTNKATFCNKTCSSQYYIKLKLPHHNITANPTTIGAIGELFACFDLLKKGFQVFRAVSPSSDADIIAEKDNVIYRFEVRTGRYDVNNQLVYSNKKTIGKSVIVITLNDNKAHYVTNPEITFF